MVVDLRKRIVDLSKKAAFAANKRGIKGQRAQVVLVLDIYRAPQPAPAFVIFLTDGGNADRRESAEVIRKLSHQPAFVQFVGIGQEDFPFLRKLDELPGRVIDNAGFMHINDLDTIKDLELYEWLLNEYPQWWVKAWAQGLLAG